MTKKTKISILLVLLAILAVSYIWAQSQPLSCTPLDYELNTSWSGTSRLNSNGCIAFYNATSYDVRIRFYVVYEDGTESKQVSRTLTPGERWTYWSGNSKVKIARIVDC